MTYKTEMVSVPRELLEHACNAVEYLALRADEVGTSNVPVADALRAILATPAEDARAVADEPVAWTVRGTSGEIDQSYSTCFRDEAESWPETLVEGCEIVPLYCHPQRPIVVPERRNVDPYSADTIMQWHKDREWNACIDEIERLNK